MSELAYMDRRATLRNKEQIMIADTMYFNNKTGYAKALSDVVLGDTTNKALMTGELAEMWRKLGKCMMTDNLRAYYYAEKDTLFAIADTVILYFDTLTNDVQRIKAFYNVSFFRSDIQGRCDSLHYAVSDSMVYMRTEPIIWAEGTQMTADSINIAVRDQAIDSMLMYPNAFIIQQDTIKGFNQVKGKQVTVYFKGNEIDHLFNEGNAESVYWLRDDDGSLIGVNFSQSTEMIIMMRNKQISKIRYYKNIKETLFPEEQLKEDQEYLKGFLWKEDEKPTREEFD